MPTAIPSEQRILPGSVQLRDLDTTASLRRLGGRAVPYGVETDLGWYIESHAAGSLTKSISEAAKGLPLLLFHQDTSWPIGLAESWSEEPDGLHGVWRLDRSEEAQRAAGLARDGLLGWMSIRFQPLRSDWTYAQDFNPDLGAAHKDRVVRLESRLLETSLVSTPAYKEAHVSWVRTAERALHRDAAGRELRGWQAYLERVRGGP